MSGASTSSLDILNLFGCGYLSPKDFKGLPYKFETSSLTCSSSNGCLVKVTGTTDAGSKYANACFWVDQAGDVHVPESTDAVCQ